MASSLSRGSSFKHERLDHDEESSMENLAVPSSSRSITVNAKDTVEPDTDLHIHVISSTQSIGDTIRLEQHAPSSSVILSDMAAETASSDDTGQESLGISRAWEILGCNSLASRFAQANEIEKSKGTLSSSVRSYYRKLDEILAKYKSELARSNNSIAGTQTSEPDDSSRTEFYAKISFFTNLGLTILKTVAAVLSGSLSVISSLVDSIMDLVSGIIIWVTSSAMKKRLPYKYPSGRTRLEPVAIVILSAIMSVASVQLVAESIQTIIALSNNTYGGISFGNVTIAVIGITMIAKAILWLICRHSSSPSVKALALDHRNDIISNMVAAVCGYVGHKYWAYLDSIGAMLIGLYILFNWWRTGAEQIKLLTGFTADPSFLNNITWVCLNFDPRIKQIDTVRAYHFGNDYIVEVHIVLPEEMSLKDAHDIGEPLQNRLESMDKVERAFVHIDYESEHDPATEHRAI